MAQLFSKWQGWMPGGREVADSSMTARIFVLDIQNFLAGRAFRLRTSSDHWQIRDVIISGEGSRFTGGVEIRSSSRATCLWVKGYLGRSRDAVFLSILAVYQIGPWYLDPVDLIRAFQQLVTELGGMLIAENQFMVHLPAPRTASSLDEAPTADLVHWNYLPSFHQHELLITAQSEAADVGVEAIFETDAAPKESPTTELDSAGPGLQSRPWVFPAQDSGPSKDVSHDPTPLFELRRQAHFGDFMAHLSLIQYYLGKYRSGSPERPFGSACRALFWYETLAAAPGGLDPTVLHLIETAAQLFRAELQQPNSTHVEERQKPVAVAEASEVDFLPIDLPQQPSFQAALTPLANDRPSPETFFQAVHDGELTPIQIIGLRQAYEAAEDWRGLLVALEKGLAEAHSDETSSLIHRELAQVKVVLGVPSRAILHYEAILQHNPSDTDAISFLRMQYANSGRHEARLRLEARLARALPEADIVPSLCRLADEAKKRELSDLQRTILLEALSQNQMDTDSLEFITIQLEPYQCWVELGQAWRKRLSSVVQTQERQRITAKATHFLLLAGEFASARILYQSVLKQFPGDVGARQALAEILGLEKNYAAQAETLEHLSRHVVGSQRVEVALKLAELYRGPLAEPETARGWLREALAEAPEDRRATTALIELIESVEDWTALVGFVRERLASVKDPTIRRELLLYLSDVYLVRLNDSERAEAYRVEAAALGGLPTDSDTSFDH